MLGAFDDWLVERGDALAIQLRIVERDPDKIKLVFVGIADAITVVVVRNEIMVVVNHEGINWDTLTWIDCVPRMGRKGAYCRMCLGDDRVFYPSYPALFVAHTFEPLAAWIEKELASAHAIGIGGCGDGSTWARLIPADNDMGYSVVIPLRG